MAEGTDVEQLLRRIQALEHRAQLEKRSGTITDVDAKKGIRIQWGGASGEPFKGPWTKPSGHHGVVVEHYPWKVGQTVTSYGMDPEHSTAVVFPHSDSTLNPADKNASMDKHTYRWRNPNPQQTQGGQQQQANGSGGGSGSGSGTQTEQPAVDNDDIDLQHTFSWDGLAHQLGKLLSRTTSRKGLNITDNVGQGSKQHQTLIDQVKGIIHSVNGLMHSMTVDPNKGIVHSAFNGNSVIQLLENAMNRTQKNGNITDKANDIKHEGPTNVDGTLGVSQLTSLIGGIDTGAFTVAPDDPILGPGPANFQGALGVQGAFSIGTIPLSSALTFYANDAAAASGGVPLHGIYWNGAALVARAV